MTKHSDSTIHYFGFGAMVNPVSRSRRGVETVSERPAVLRDYQLSFGETGVGTVNPLEGASVHGVLMEFQDAAHWKIIQDFEAGYDVLQSPVYPYGSEEPIMAFFFQIPREKIKAAAAAAATNGTTTKKKPQERCLKIIRMGMEHHGVDAAYVKEHIMKVDCVPSRKPDDYLYFPTIATDNTELPTYTWQQYQDMVVKDQRTCFLIGTKVIEILVDYDAKHPMMGWIQLHLLGKKSCTWTLYQVLYEPDLPDCDSEANLLDLHRAWAENQLFDFCRESNFQAQAIGRLV